MTLPETEAVDHPRKREEKTQNADSNYTIKLEQSNQLASTITTPQNNYNERSGQVVECLTRDRKASGSSLTGVTALWSLSKTHLS